MKRLTLVFLFFSCAKLVLAQVEFHGRYEREFEFREDDVLVISNEEVGLTMVQTDFRTSGKEYKLYITQLDSDMALKQADTVKINRSYNLLGYHFVNGKTYLMLQDTPAKSKIKILRLDNKSGLIDEYEPKELLEMDVQEFEVIKNTAVIGGLYEMRPVVLAYDFENDKVRTLSNVYQNDSELVEVKINSDNLTFNVLATQKNERKDRTIIVNTYDYLGNAIRDYTIETKLDYQLITAVSSSINDISQVIVGLYGYKNTTSPAGYFVNYIDRKGKQTMNYYSFGELPHFFDYMGEKRAARYKERALKLKKSGKDGHYRLHPMFREMHEENNQLVVFGEFVRGFNKTENDFYTYNGFGRAYYPVGVPNYGYPYSTPGMGSTRTSEYDFTHAYTLVLNKTGEIQWDDWFEIDQEMSGGLDRYGAFSWNGEHAAYAFYVDKEIHAKVMDKSGESEGIVQELRLSDGDELKYEYEASLKTIRWYGDYFVIYGVQNVRSVDKSTEQQKVFFINKITIKKPPKASGID